MRMFIIQLFTFFLFISSISFSITYNIAVIPKGSTHDFWLEVEKGALKAGKEFDATVVFRGPKYDDDTNAQIKLVEYFIKQKVDAIVLAPNHKTELVDIVDEALAANIKVIIIDSGLDSNNYQSFIATDNFMAGKLAGKKLANIINNKGNVGIIKYYAGNASTELREAGFMEAMKENKIPVIVNEYGGATIGLTLKKGLEILEKKPNIVGLFTPNESSTIGMAKALERTNLYKQIALVGFDYNSEIQNMMKKGLIKGVIVQQPEQMGYLGVKTAIESLKGEKINKKIVVDSKFIISK